MRKLFLALITLLVPFITIAQSTGKELVAASINFHDPDSNWSTTKATFNFLGTRPGGDDRAATLYLNNTNSTICIMREKDGTKVTRHTENDNCTYDINGNFTPSAEEIEKFKLNDKRSLMLRNYYLYLWGLPMKLKDSGTIVDETIYEKEFNGRKTKAARVTYEAEVGKDIWYFYFDPSTYEMIGYQFFHDEAKGDGEYILLSGLVNVNDMKIPKNRAWYTNSDSALLGTDHLVNATTLVHSH